MSSLMILLTTLDILFETVSSLPKKKKLLINSESYACHVSAHTLPLIKHSTTFITRYSSIILFRPCNPPPISTQYTLLYTGDKSLVPTLLSYPTLPLPLSVIALWSGTNKNRDVSTGPLACPFVRSLAPLTRLLAPDCSLRSRHPLRSLVRSLAHFAHSLARGKVNL